MSPSPALIELRRARRPADYVAVPMLGGEKHEKLHAIGWVVIKQRIWWAEDQWFVEPGPVGPVMTEEEAKALSAKLNA